MFILIIVLLIRIIIRDVIRTLIIQIILFVVAALMIKKFCYSSSCHYLCSALSSSSS